MPGGERAPPRLGCVGPKPLSSVYVPRNISMPSSAKMNMTRKRIMKRFMICEVEVRVRVRGRVRVRVRDRG